MFHGGVRRRGCDVDIVVGACGDVAGGRQDDTAGCGVGAAPLRRAGTAGV